MVTRIFDAADPAWATSAAEYRRGPKARPTNGIMLLAELGGRPVGAARASEALDGLIPRPGTFGARIAVLPGAEGRGVGRQLWKAIRQWLDPQTPAEINSWANHGDHRSVAIAATWGFERRPGSIEEPADLADDQPWAWDYELRLDQKGSVRHRTAPLFPKASVCLHSKKCSTIRHCAHHSYRAAAGVVPSLTSSPCPA